MNLKRDLKLNRTLFIVVFVLTFIIIYFLYLVEFHLKPNQIQAPIILLIGFSLYIFGFFYFFLNLINSMTNKIVLKFKWISENAVISILLFLMIITYFIPATDFSDMIMDWSQISILNYFRGIIFLIGCAFVPGCCIINLILPNNKLHERFNVEPFLIKIVIYPVTSFIFIGTIVLLADQLGLRRDLFSPLLFIVIITLFFVNLILQKQREKRLNLFKSVEINISKSTGFILFMTSSIITISLGIFIFSKYLIEADGYVALSYTNYIGLTDTNPTDKFYTYAIYWSYIYFGLSSLCGIPVINLNAISFPFLYLFVISIYLLIKSFLGNKKEKIVILATIFAITFSSLFYGVITNDQPHERISLFIFDGIITFRYKSFAIILSLVSMALFSKILKPENFFVSGSSLKKENFILILFSSFLLIQSYMIYFFPGIPAISLLLILICFSREKERIFKYYITFLISFIGFFIFFDIILHFYLSWIPLRLFPSFLGINFYLEGYDFNSMLFINGLLFYLFLATFLILNIILFKIYRRYSKIERRKPPSLKLDTKFLFQLISIVFSAFLILEIILNIVFTIRRMHFFTFFIHVFFYNIGSIGIIGLYLLYFTLKKEKEGSLILVAWFLFFTFISLSMIIIRWISYPTLNPIQIPQSDYFYMIHWFSRIWYYSIIPLSIFNSIGLLILIRNMKKIKILRKLNTNSIFMLKLSSISFLLILSISNTIIAGAIINDDINIILTDEEAQTVGWVAENIPRESNILVDRHSLFKYLSRISRTNTFFIDREIEKAYENLTSYKIVGLNDSDCDIEYYELLDSRNNVLKLLDNNSIGNAFISTELDKIQYYGTLEFSLKSSNASNMFTFNVSSIQDILGISLKFQSKSFYIVNSSGDFEVMSIEDDTWYNIKINFECTNGGYLGLEIYNFKIIVNNVSYGEYAFWNNIYNFNKIEFATSKNDSLFYVLFDNLNFSWQPDFRLEFYLFNFLPAKEYLIMNEIEFFVLSKGETEYKNKAEEYIDIENELLPNYYIKRIYYYKNLTIYSSN